MILKFKKKDLRKKSFNRSIYKRITYLIFTIRHLYKELIYNKAGTGERNFGSRMNLHRKKPGSFPAFTYKQLLIITLIYIFY